jgi:SAM-dependent methyltransferase
VLVAECRDGRLLADLQVGGVDSYGVEPSPLFVTATEAAVDVRNEAAGTHLRTLPRASLGGVVLAGCTDTLPVPALAELLDVVLTRLGPGGRVVIVSAGPKPPVGREQIVASDLAPGRPLHAETWAALLAARGFREISRHPAAPSADDGPYAVVATT